jgi:hypothetical protein
MLRATYSEVVRTVAARVNAVPARACPRPESTLACLPCLLALLAHSALVQPSPPVCSCSLSLSLSLSLSAAAARSQCIGTSGGKAQALSSCCSRCASSHAGVDPAAGRQEGAQPARARPVGAVRERCAGEPRPGRQHQARTHARHQGRHISRRSPEPFPNMRNSRNGEKGRYKGL